MNQKHYFTAIFIFAAIFFAGCAPSMHVIYSFSNIFVPETVQTIPIHVDMRTLADNRANSKQNTILFTDYHLTTVNGKKMCINAERFYNKDAVVKQATQMLVNHFNKAKLFKHTSYNENADSEYYITGILNRLYGEQEFSTSAAEEVAFVGYLFGAVASGIAAENVKAKSAGKIIIEISDLKLFKKDGTLVKDFGSFYKEYEGKFDANADCWCIYQNINAILRDFNTELIETMRAELLEMNFKERY